MDFTAIKTPTPDNVSYHDIKIIIVTMDYPIKMRFDNTEYHLYYNLSLVSYKITKYGDIIQLPSIPSNHYLINIASTTTIKVINQNNIECDFNMGEPPFTYDKPSICPTDSSFRGILLIEHTTFGTHFIAGVLNKNYNL